MNEGVCEHLEELLSDSNSFGQLEDIQIKGSVSAELIIAMCENHEIKHLELENCLTFDGYDRPDMKKDHLEYLSLKGSSNEFDIVVIMLKNNLKSLKTLILDGGLKIDEF